MSVDRRYPAWTKLWMLLIFGLLSVPNTIRYANASEANGWLGPCALIASSDANTLYVACADARCLLWVDLTSGKVTRRISLPDKPTGVTLNPDGTKLIVTCAAPQSMVVLLDAVSGRKLASVRVGHTATSPVVSPDGTRLYVCNRFNDDVSILELATGKPLARVPVVRQPIASAITPDGRTLMVANHLANVRSNVNLMGQVSPVVTALDTQTLATSSIELPSGSNSLRDLCVSPDGRYALVTHLLANFQEIPFRVDTGWINVNVVSIVDTQEKKYISTIGLDEYYYGSGNPYGITYSADGKTVCVGLTGSHELGRIAAADLLGDVAHRTMRPMMGVWPIYLSLGESLWKRKRLPGNGPRGMAAAGSKVYVAEYFSDTVAVVDLDLDRDWKDDRDRAYQSADNDPTFETIRLGPPIEWTPERRGERLFHDATICFQHWVSCASCHPDGRTDSLNWDLMNDGAGNPKNTKSLLFSHQTPPAMATGVRKSAEVAVRAGIEHILFAERPESEAADIDAYLRSLKPIASPHLLDGRFTPSAVRGRELFHDERIGCDRCHPEPLFTDLRRHDVGTSLPRDRIARFDTPTLVETWRTAPYLHDGRYATIRELLVEGRHGLRAGRVDRLNERALNDLIEFVKSL